MSSPQLSSEAPAVEKAGRETAPEQPRGDAAAAHEAVKPAEKHFPVTKQEVEQFASRMEDISRVLHEYLNEDPVAAAEKQRAREAARAKERADTERQKLLDRYDPRRYVRFESDALINRLLEEVDKPPPPKPVSSRVTHLSEFESLSLEEAERQKSEGNACFKKGDYVRAKELYTRAMELAGSLDDALVEALQNNRGQVNIFLKEYVSAVEDTSAVLQRHPTNVKARLRRATALSALHRPTEALQDLREALKGEPRNAEALRLLDAVSVEKKEMDWCSEFEQTSKSCSAALKEAILVLERVATAAATTSTSAPPPQFVLPPSGDCSTLVVRAPDAAEVVSCLARCQEYLWERGAPTFFRIHGGLAAIRKLVEAWLPETVDGQRAVVVVVAPDGGERALEEGHDDDDTSEQSGRRNKRIGGETRQPKNPFVFATAVAAAVRTLAEALKSEVALDLLTTADAARYTDMAVSLLFADGVLCRRIVDAAFQPAGETAAAVAPTMVSSSATAAAAARDSASNDQRSAGVEELLCTSALQLCESLSSKYATMVVERLHADAAAKVLQLSLSQSRGGLAVLYRSLKLFDILLRCDAAAAAYANVDFVVPSLAALAQPSLAFGEVSTGMLLRLSVALPTKLDIFSKPEVLRSVCEITTRSLAPPAGTSAKGGSSSKSEDNWTSPLLQEGLCSLLYNRLLQQQDGGTAREGFVEFLEKHGVYSRIHEFLSGYATTLTAAAPASSATTVRPLLSVAKACLALLGKSLAAQNASLNDCTARHIDALWMMFDVLRLFPVVGVVSAEGGLPCAELSVDQKEDQRYVRLVVEHASLCLAHLYTGSKAVLMPGTLNRRDRLSTLLDCLVLKEQPVAVGNVALILSVVPQEAHAHMEALDAVRRVLAALVALRAELHHLESEGQRDSTAHRHTKAAQKNLAIALSRLCTTEPLLLQVREQRGFEILYAALDRNPDGTIKEEKA